LVTGSGTFLTEGIFDTAVDWSLRYTFVNGLTLHYESGGLGVRFEGSDGYVEADFNRVDSSIPEVAAGLICPGGTVEPMEPMTEIRNFLDCIRTRRTPLDAVEDGHRAASLAHLGNIVLRLNRSVAWDPQAEIILDDPVANSMCRRALRAPWKYPV
jgi:predicted dehydrogenase